MAFKRGKNEDGTETTGHEETTTQNQTPETSQASDVMSEGDLGKVRDLLVGSQMRKVREEMNSLQQQVQDLSARLREDVEKQVTRLERTVTEKTDSAIDRATREGHERRAAIEALDKTLHALDDAFAGQLSELEESIQKTQREFQAEVQGDVKRLHTRIDDRHEQAINFASDAVQALRISKVDRAALSSLLVEFGMRVDPDAAAKGTHGESHKK